MEYILFLIPFLLVLVVVALAIATHYQTKLNRQLKREYEAKLLEVMQLHELKDLQRRNQEVTAENKALKERHVSIGREQFLSSLN